MSLTDQYLKFSLIISKKIIVLRELLSKKVKHDYQRAKNPLKQQKTKPRVVLKHNSILESNLGSTGLLICLLTDTSDAGSSPHVA